MKSPATKIAFKEVSKCFSSKYALNGVSCEVRRGSVHAFLGENGAGKSTLMKILDGTYSPSAGEVQVDGQRVLFDSPRRARSRGISTIHQNSNLVPTMTVLENILLGDRRLPWIINRRKAAESVRELIEVHGFNLDIHSPVWKLEASDRQKVDIFRLVWQDSDVLILDEPTSQLTPFESADVLTLLRQLAGSGKTILLVTHNISEAIGHSDQISVLRQGRLVGDFAPKTSSIQELAQAMIGSRVVASNKTKLQAVKALPYLTLSEVTTSNSYGSCGLSEVNLDVFRGEVIGIAGVSESGPYELCKLLAGHRVPKKGVLYLEGIKTHWSELSSRRKSFAYVPADPRATGTVSELTLVENCFLRDIFDSRFSNLITLKRKTMQKEGRKRISRFDVTPNDLSLSCGVLSGGNLQRLLLGREFALGSSLFVAINPTAGLDFAACQYVVESLREYAHQGNAVVVASPNIEELLSVSDRIAVFCKGRIAGIERPENLSMESLGMLMGGVSVEN
jgi:general nucleoside transport system ATP-binding protein